ncbi:sigma factor [Nocardioides sp.]|uniref:sigma factor n=1 Tax=Nocardioides sp. TaxID=35761 RepID=UPI002C7EDB20|nr:sigma factor [Nocardioides sp.]HXH80742.1 sigma factor [Nocardioides sp.]
MTTPRTERLPHLPEWRRATVSGVGAQSGEAATDAVDESLPPDALLSLLKQAAEGDEAAFSAVYDATCARAYGLGLRLVHDPVQAAEYVQEAYLHLWMHAACFKSADSSPISWILMNVHQCIVRRARSMAAPLASGGPSVQTADGAACGLVDDPPNQRQAVELAYFGGYTHTEVEELTDLPAGTARLRMRDGLLELRDPGGTMAG